MPARSLSGSLGENVMVLGYPPLPTWLLSDGHQARQGLDTDIMTFHIWLSILQMVAPQGSHLTPPSNGGRHLHGCPTKIFYKSSVHCASGLTFG